MWEAAWSLTELSGLDGEARVYLALYLIAGMNEEEVGEALKLLARVAKGENVLRLAKYGLGFLKYAYTPDGAARILEYWQQGEKIGHEHYIQELLRGGRKPRD